MYIKVFSGLVFFGLLASADSVTMTSNVTGSDEVFSGAHSVAVDETSAFGGLKGNVDVSGDALNGFTITGNIVAYKNITPPGQISPNFLGTNLSILLNLPEDSGNWRVTGYESAQDDEGIPGLNYNKAIDYTMLHSVGNPLQYNFSQGVSVETQDSSDAFQFAFRLVDPPDQASATPEPATFWLMGLPIAALVLAKKRLIRTL